MDLTRCHASAIFLSERRGDAIAFFLKFWYTKNLPVRRHSQVVRHGSAKPVLPSSNLGAAFFRVNKNS